MISRFFLIWYFTGPLVVCYESCGALFASFFSSLRSDIEEFLISNIPNLAVAPSSARCVGNSHIFAFFIHRGNRQRIFYLFKSNFPSLIHGIRNGVEQRALGECWKMDTKPLNTSFWGFSGFEMKILSKNITKSSWDLFLQTSMGTQTYTRVIDREGSLKGVYVTRYGWNMFRYFVLMRVCYKFTIFMINTLRLLLINLMQFLIRAGKVCLRLRDISELKSIRTTYNVL